MPLRFFKPPNVAERHTKVVENWQRARLIGKEKIEERNSTSCLAPLELGDDLIERIRGPAVRSPPYADRLLVDLNVAPATETTELAFQVALDGVTEGRGSGVASLQREERIVEVPSRQGIFKNLGFLGHCEVFHEFDD